MHLLTKTLFLSLLTLLTACTTIPAQSPPQWVGYRQSGEASFYSSFYQFQTTASGERFNQFAATAAHRKLPFGTRVKVTNVKNGKSVVVKINDRGPFVKNRIIDLSRSAFGDIADTGVGVIDVTIEVVQ